MGPEEALDLEYDYAKWLADRLLEERDKEARAIGKACRKR